MSVTHPPRDLKHTLQAHLTISFVLDVLSHYPIIFVTNTLYKGIIGFTSYQSQPQSEQPATEAKQETWANNLRTATMACQLLFMLALPSTNLSWSLTAALVNMFFNYVADQDVLAEDPSYSPGPT